MDRPSGSFIDDGEGNIQPNLDDEAMKKRNGIEDKKEVALNDKRKTDNPG